MHFEAVRLVILESNRQVRQALVAHLFHHGFRDIADTDRLSDVVERVTSDSVDLLIASVNNSDDMTAASVLRKLRHQEIGDNPFVVAALMTTNTAFDAVNALLDTGPDDVLLAPISVGVVHKRIMALAHKRKPFVVTSEYIGPDRLSGRIPKGREEIPLISVPNPLRVKATGEGLSELANQIQQSKQIINGMSIDRASRQIVYVGRKLPTYSQNQDDRSTVITDFQRMTTSLAVLRRLIPGTAYESLETPAGRLASALDALGSDPTIGTVGARQNVAALSEALFQAIENLNQKTRPSVNERPAATPRG